MEKYKIDLVIRGESSSDKYNNIWYAIPMAMNKYKKIKYTDTISTTKIINKIKNNY